MGSIAAKRIAGRLKAIERTIKPEIAARGQCALENGKAGIFAPIRENMPEIWAIVGRHIAEAQRIPLLCSLSTDDVFSKNAIYDWITQPFAGDVPITSDWIAPFTTIEAMYRPAEQLIVSKWACARCALRSPACSVTPECDEVGSAAFVHCPGCGGTIARVDE